MAASQQQVSPAAKYPRDGFMAAANDQWRLIVWRSRGRRVLAFAKGLLGGNVATCLSETEVSEYKILIRARKTIGGSFGKQVDHL
jgi:hypothetical protein